MGYKNIISGYQASGYLRIEHRAIPNNETFFGLKYYLIYS